MSNNLRSITDDRASTIGDLVLVPTLEIPIKGAVALIDEADLDMIRGFNWALRVQGTSRYAIGHRNNRTVFMHRLILRPPAGLLTDHRNRNGLNNRRINLRACTPADNARNTSLPVTNTSGFKGVYAAAPRYTKRWTAGIRVNRKTNWLGYFASAEEAAVAYDAAAIRLHGEFAATNRSLGLLMGVL